jgi:hypothetical protein
MRSRLLPAEGTVKVAARTPGCDVGRKNDVGVFRLHKSSAFADDFIPLKMTIEK